MNMPAPQSFTTLEAAQAEIARLQDLLRRAAPALDKIEKLQALLPEINQARADIDRVLSKP